MLRRVAKIVHKKWECKISIDKQNFWNSELELKMIYFVSACMHESKDATAENCIFNIPFLFSLLSFIIRFLKYFHQKIQQI